MIFMTLILLLYTVYKLANRKRVKELAKELLKLNKIGYENYDDKNKANNLLIKGLLYSIGWLVYIVIFIAYLSVAIKYDPFKIPTVVMLVIFFIIVFVSVVNSNDKEKVNQIITNKTKKGTILGNLSELLIIGYLFYMLLNLI